MTPMKIAGPVAPKFGTKVHFNWENKAVTVVVTFTSIEEAGKAVDFVQSTARMMFPNICFRGDDDYDEDEINE
jgi:hypothetical protein